jgi:ligand-binding sensor domain-containing protein
MNKKIIFIVVFLLSGIQSLHAQWTSVNSSIKDPIVQSLILSGSNVIAGTPTGVYISTDNGTDWTGSTSGMTKTDVRSLAVLNGGTKIYAGTAGGGVYLSGDNGSSWTAANAGLTNANVYALAVLGTNLYAGTYGGGVFLSTDYGLTWSPVNNGLSNLYINALAVSGTDLFVGTDGGGIFRSTNSGATWSGTSNGLLNTQVNTIAVYGSYLYAGTYGGGVFLSTNNGAGWSGLGTNLTNNNVLSLAVSGSYLYAGTNGGGVYRSPINGQNWTIVNNGLANTHVNALAISQTTLYAGTLGGGVFSSSDDGASWAAGSMNPYAMAIAVNGSDIYAGTYGGVYRSSTKGATWSQVFNIVAPSTASQSFAFSGSNLFTGISIVGVLLSTNNGQNWNYVNAGLTNYDIRSLAVSASGTKVFAGTAGGGVFLSSNNGLSWSSANTGLTDKYIFALAVSGAKIFAGTNSGVFLSTNNGASWTATNSALNGIRVWALAVDGQNLFAGTSQGVYSSSDNGASWYRFNSGLSNTDVRSLTISGTNLFAGTYGGGVYQYSNNAASWTAINQGLPSSPVYALACTDEYLFAGMLGGGISRRPLSDVTSPTAPTLSTPLDSASGVSTTPSLGWNVTLGAVWYQLQVSADSGFLNLVVNQTGISGSSFTVGNLSNKRYFWRVNATNARGTSAWSSVRSFTTTVDAPVLTYPTDGSQDISVAPVLTWIPSSGALSYQVQLSDSFSFSHPIIDQKGIATSSFAASGLIKSTTYYWRVNAANSAGTGAWSVIQSFKTTIGPPPATILTSPANGVSGVSTNPVFVWSPSSGTVTYRLQVATDSIFSAMLVNEGGISTTTRGVFGLAGRTTFFWRVNATNVGGTSPWSTVRKFTTLMSPPILVSPDDGAVDVPINSSLTWLQSDGAISYQVQVSTDPDFSTTDINASGITSVSYAAFNLLKNTTYYWRVNATDTSGTSAWSATKSFTTLLSIPGKVVLIGPSNPSRIGADSVRFTWYKGVPSVTSYEFELTGDSTTVRVSFDTTIMAKVPAGKTEKAFIWRVRAKNIVGFGPYSDPWSLLRLTTSVSATPQNPEGFVVYNNYPNPFNPSTTFSFDIPIKSYVELKIFDTFGREVAVVYSGELPAGAYTRQWNAERLPSGMYFYRLQAGLFSETNRLLLLK